MVESTMQGLSLSPNCIRVVPRMLKFQIVARLLVFWLGTLPLPGQMTPIPLIGFNRDIVIESNAVQPPYGSYALEFNPGEGTCFYQQGLPGTTYGLPASGQFSSAVDGTIFQFQPYTASNALVMSSETGITAGTLTLTAPAIYSGIALIANSASATATSAGTVTLDFADGSTFTTNFDAADWFRNPGFALDGVDRINIGTGGTDGGPQGNPRFYQTTLDLAALFGATNQVLMALTFTQAPDARSTAVYAVSGALSASNSFTLPVITNGTPIVQAGSAIFTGGVASTGGNIPSVTVYYGPNDGGTVASAWSNSVPVGFQTGAFSQTLTNLVPGVTYYATAQARNFAGAAWASPSKKFSTPVTPTAGAPVATPANSVSAGTPVTLTAAVSGAPPFHYQWQSNGANISNATNSSLVFTNTTVSMSGTYDVVVTNAYGSTTSPSLVLTVSAQPAQISFFNNGANWTVNQSGVASANITSNVLSGTDGAPNEWVTAWYNNQVSINGFTATFTYQNPGDIGDGNADGASFTVQESGPSFLSTANGGSGLGIQGLTPSADWEINIYSGNGIGIAYNSDGVPGGYQGTSNIDVASGDPINFTIIYAPGGAVQESVSDATTGATFVTNYNIGDITALLGSSFAYIGLSASSGGTGGVQTISDFTFQTGSNGFTLAVVTNLPATAIAPEAATLVGQVVSNGTSPPTITLYYGTSDGGTNAANWANRVNLGAQTGAFSQAITGLSPNTTYYYAASAANVAGISWASPSQSFTTTSVALPQITNLAATVIGANVATLNGQVVSTGGALPAVTLYYGPANGGANAAAWSNSISLGLQSGAFAQTVSSLASNTTYYFTAEASNSAGAVWAAPPAKFTTVATNPLSTAVSVLTYHNDNTRMGVNTNETILTLANVNTNNFGRLFAYDGASVLDGFVYAQPLVMPGVNIPGKGTHNVVFVATEHDSVYAFDADSNVGPNAAPLWHTTFLGTGVTTVPYGDVGTSDITPEVGITSTPVIDPVSGTIYCEVKTLEQGTTYVHRLHALDITTGLERSNFNSPVLIQCTNYPGFGNGDNDGQTPPHVLWNPLRSHSRPALTLLNGVVYMSFASHGDNQPYHGWFFGYNATNLALAPGAYNSTPNGVEGGFWDGGGGPSVDPQGNMYLQTGNGSFDEVSAVTASNNYAMSLIKFSTTNGLKMADFFAPYNAVSLSGGDQDLGSSAPIILPDSAGSAAHPHLVVGGGKTAPIYLVDRDNMGRFNSANDNQIVQQFNGGPGGDRDVTPAFFNNTLYVIDGNSKIGAYSISNAVFNTTPVETPDTYYNKGGATACISANGAGNAIVWAIYNSGGETPTGPGILRAYDATNITKELYSSDQVASRDSAGDAVKFIAPTIANGKVYVGGQYNLTVYGLATAFVSTPVISPGGGIYTNSVTVSLSDATAGAAIYYTLDGTAPTTNSTLYSAPFVITNSVAVTAGAFKPGAVASGIATASFINSSAVGSGSGLLGEYWANTTSAAFIAPGFNTPPTLTRVDPDINFNWSFTPPATNVGPTVYVVRWTGSIEPQFNETYTFSTTTDDGALLWVNGQLLVNDWVDQSPTTFSGQIALGAQERYNIEMEYYQNGGGAVAQLAWSSPSTAMEIIPQTQLYPLTNPPPAVALTTPTNGASYTASASVSLTADAATQFNSLTGVAFFAGTTLLGSVTNPPYTLTATGLAAGSYTLTAIAVDGSGLGGTSAPVNITVTASSGKPYGLTNVAPAPAFYNMPAVFTGLLPQQLSLTGVFTNTPAMAPAASLIPYAPNVPFWSDGAQKLRYFSVPHAGGALTSSEQIGFAPAGAWSFPAGTVFAQTFELQTNQSDPTSLMRLETRLLVRDANGAVYGVTYKWRPDYSDADLLTTNVIQAIPIATPSGVITQMWYYPSPSDCLQCHTAPANYVLGVNARQLNANFAYPNGVTDNELRALNRAGLFYPAISESQIPNIEQLSALTNATASLAQRARSYLDANCAQCHQPGGSGPTFDARYDTPLAGQNIINTPAAKGNFGYDNVNIVTPSDVWRSSLYDRMNALDASIEMPPLARNLIDTNAVQVMAQWINSLGGAPALPPPAIAPPGGTYQGFVNLTVTPPANNVTIHYTLDGSLPTTNSPLYSGPFKLTNSAVVNANAWEPGYANSVVGAAQFTILPGVLFTAPGAFVNGAFQMTLAGPVGSSYVLQTSTNLTQWTSISTNTPAASPFILSDPSAANSGDRFYRVIQQP